MALIINVFKSLALWQIAVLVLVLFGAAGATYGGYARVSAPNVVKLEENQQLIPVRLGRLVNEISTNGNLTFPNRETLIFGSPGVVAEVLVEEGWLVEAGQVVAKLDSSAVAALEEGVAQARFNLEKANEALDDLVNPSPTILAQGLEKVADARLQLQLTVDALEEARKPYTQQEIDTQRKLVADTRLLLQEATQSLAGLAGEHALLLAQARQSKADAELDLEKALNAVAEFPGDFALRRGDAGQSKADAELNLDLATAALDDFAPDYSQELAQSRQTKADAEIALEQAQIALDRYAPDYGQDLAEARQKKADAEVALSDAQEGLADLALAYETQLAQARQAKPDAEISLEQADSALTRYEAANARRLDGPRQDRVELQGQLEQSQAHLAGLLQVQDQGSGSPGYAVGRTELEIAALKDRLATAEEALAGVDRLLAARDLAQTILDQSRVDLAELELGPDAFLRPQQEAAVALAEANLEEALANLAELDEGGGLSQRQQLQAVLDLARENRDRAQAGLAKLEAGPDALERQQLQAAVELAQASLRVAQQTLGELDSQPDQQVVEHLEGRVARAQAALDEARQAAIPGQADVGAGAALASASLKLAQETLAAIKAGADPLELASTEAKVAVARSGLAGAMRDLSELSEEPDPLDVAAKEAEVARLEAALAQGQEDLAEMLEGADAAEVALKEKQVASAEASLADEEENLAELLKGPDPSEVALREAEAASAQQALQDAQQLLEDSSLKAPFDGFVAAVNVEAGDEVQPRTPIADIVDPSVIEVDGIVDQVDVLSVRLGTPAEVTVDALPGETLQGVVTQVSPGASNQQGVVTYPIRIQVEVPPGVTLREGLSAVANIILQEERDVLLVPQQALYGIFDAPLVKVVNEEGVIEERAVVLGNTDDFWVAVRSGLKEGDQVAMESADVATSQFSFRQFRRVTGASGRGGSRGGRR